MAADAPPASTGPLVLRIKLRYPDVATFIEKFAMNVGRSGLFLATRGLQPVGTELRFELRLLDDQVVLAGVGRVQTVHEPKEDQPEAPYGMVIEFMRATRESRELVLRMIEHRRAHGLGEPALPGPPEPAAGGSAARRPAALPAERPRQPRPSAAELVAALAARPPGEDGGGADSIEGLAATTAEPMDLRRISQRARVIAANASEAELEALALPGAASAMGAAGAGATMGTAAGASAAGANATAGENAAAGNTAGASGIGAASRAPASAAPPRRVISPFSSLPPPGAAPAPVPTAQEAREAAVARERFSSLPRRTDAEPAPAGGPSPTPPSPLSPGASASPAAPAAAAPGEPEDGGAPEPEPRRRRVSRPERLTRPPNVFARSRNTERGPLHDRSTDDPETDRVADVPDESSAPARGNPPLPRTITAERPLPRTITAERPAPRDSLDATLPAFERVLAELEESERDQRPAARTAAAAATAAAVAGARAALAPVPAGSGRGAAHVPFDPLDQLALDDLDDADPGIHRATTPNPWPPTLDETVPTEPVDLDDSFEILAEAELEASDLESGAARIAPSLPLGSSRPAGAGSAADAAALAALAAPTALLPEEPGDSFTAPQTARSALAAAVSRPTWTRSKALDAPEPLPPLPDADLAPPTIPGRVPTREIDLESALDALDIEAEAPVVPLRPRAPEPAAPDEDDFPIELEFDD